MDKEESRWFRVENPHASCVLVHGLNQRPSSLQWYIDCLNQRRINVYRLTLTGHTSKKNEMRQVKAQDWENNLQEGLSQVQKEGLPYFYFGYSNGALQHFSLLRKEKSYSYPFQIFLAPALKLRSVAYLYYPLKLLPSSWMLPSRAPEDYCIHSGTSLAAYGLTIEKAHKIGPFPIGPTLSFIHPRDELISAKKLKEFIQAMPQWDHFELPDRLPQPYHHLLINPSTMGEVNSAFLWEGIDNFLSKNLL